jgi:hypothetical protein
MKDYKMLLTSFIEVTTFLLASFGGFLKKVAPPVQVGASYPVGMLSFLVLIILLIVSALGRRRPENASHKLWLAAGTVLFVLALTSGILYPSILSRYTYPEQIGLDARKVRASDEYLTTDARQYRDANPSATPEDLEQNLPDNDVWTASGIERAETKLLVTYAVLVLSVAGAIFCLLESNMAGIGNSSRHKRRTPIT